jgi:hypothetical protein
MVELAELLADRFTVINYDRRGRGDSGDAEPYAVEREIEDLQALLDEAAGSASAWGLVVRRRARAPGRSPRAQSKGRRSTSRPSGSTLAVASHRPTSRCVSRS